MPAYSYWRRITIDSGLVGEDDADFAFLFSSTLADLATVGNGGRIENTDAAGGASGALTVPADLVFAAQADGTDVYSFEVEYYDATTGELVAWVQSGVSSAVDTVLYLVYGDVEIIASQEDIVGTWSADFQAVWHMGEASGVRFDSKGNNDLTDNNTVLQNTGQVGYAADFEDGNDEYLNVADSPALSINDTTDLTITLWVYLESKPAHDMRFLSKYFHWTPAREYGLHWGTGPDRFGWTMYHNDNTNHTQVLSDTFGAPAAGTWYFVVVYLNTVGVNEIGISVDNGAFDTGSHADIGNDNTAQFEIGLYTGWMSELFDGRVDEYQFAKTLRSANYLTTCYNSQDDPSTFYSVSDLDRVRPASAASLPGLLIA